MKALSLVLVLLAFMTVAAGRQSAQAAGDFATRTIENGTPIPLTVGDVVFPATLNNSQSAKELISRLPYTVTLQRYSHDYCGVMDDPLSYDEKDAHHGWLNGDIDFARDGNSFTVLFEDEERSQQYGHQITLGKVDGPLSVLKALESVIEMKRELAK